MKPAYRRSAALALFASALLAVASPALAEPFALLASVRGRVDVIVARTGEKARASFGRALERGDRIEVAAGGGATVYFSDGNVIELGEKSSVTVGGRVANPARVGPGAGLAGPVYQQVARVVTGGSRETGLVAISQMRGADAQRALILAPRASHVLTGRPAFAWRAAAGADRYRVTVSDEHGEVWSREVAEGPLAWPADAPAARSGADYLWTLEALSDRGALRREESAFHVVEADDERVVRENLARIEASAGGPDHPATHFLAGSYLAGRGLHHDAARHFERLGALVPESPAAHEALGNVYRTIGLMDLAAESFQKALALTRQD
uniref:Tetratricopeptide repeat protein n=1 Tax=Eiseniibacteriota bacterium TaxID=2212470 RepID=A0A832I5Y1_UNCEI